MTRTKLSIRNFSDLSVAGSSPVSFDAAIDGENGNYIDTGGDTRGLVLLVKNTSGSAITARLKAGDNPPALHNGAGDIDITVAATTGFVFIANLESMWCNQSDSGSTGAVFIDFLSGGSAIANTGGSAQAYRLINGGR